MSVCSYECKKEFHQEEQFLQSKHKKRRTKRTAFRNMKRNLYAFKENHIEDVLASFSCSLVYLKRPTNEIYTTDLYIVDSCQSEANGKEKETETNAALKLLHIVEYPNVNRSNAWKFERWKLHSVCMSWSNTSGQNVWRNARTHRLHMQITFYS